MFEFRNNINSEAYKHETQRIQLSKWTERKYNEEHAPAALFDDMFINEAGIKSYGWFQTVKKELIEIVSKTGTEDTKDSV